MKETVNHPTYGQIAYTEGFWSGKKHLTINDCDAQKVSKNVFMVGEKKAIVMGNVIAGVKLCIDSETIQLSPKPKWYEYALSILPLAFVMIWGNSETLCSIFPIAGGALGGLLGGVGFVTSLLLMKKAKSLIYKLLIGIGIFIGTVFAAFLLVTMLILLVLLA